MKRRGLYTNDLAHIHHAGFGGFARGAGPGLLRLLRRAGLRRGPLVDLACGSGLWAATAQRAGFDVIGVDISPAMIRLAKRTAPGARFHRGSLYDFALPACDVVTVLGEGLNYLPAHGREPDLGRLIAKVSRALRPGGMFIFDVMTAGGKPMNYQTWREGKDWAVWVQVTEQRRQRRLRRDIVTFLKRGAAYRRAGETHRMRLLARAEIERRLRRAGFDFRVMRCYGKMPLAPRRLAFVARKPRAGETEPGRAAFILPLP